MGSRGKSSSSRRKDDVTLFLDCVDEDLCEAQLTLFNKAMDQYKETSANIDNLLKAGVIDVNERGKDYVALEFKEGVNGLNVSNMTKLPNIPSAPGPRVTAAVSGQTPSLVLQNPGVPSVPGSTYQLMVDPRSLGLYVSQNSPQVPPTSASSTVPIMAMQPTAPLAATMSTSSVVSSTPLTPQSAVTGPTAIRGVVRAQTATVRPQAATVQPQAVIPIAPSPGLVPISSVLNSATKTTRAKTVRITTTPTYNNKSKPTETSSVGGIVQKKTPATQQTVGTVVVDLTDDDTKTSPTADSREIMFNKLSGKTYPSLVVVARPSLRVKDFTQAQVAGERASLDAKMKAVLMGTPTKFTEWLIQQGLVRSEQYCTKHINPDHSPIKLKLGMYSDVSKFPYSGGYVWISECCPQRFVSVFSGSLFEGAPHAPTVLVKLLYHWSCQTSVNNISAWVKVDGLYVKSFYTNIRSVCTAAVHEKFEKLGGSKRRVELGVISLGTTSQDGSMRQVKVEVLGVYDPESKLIRLRAVEPLQDGERNYKRRFVKILEPLEEWVHKESIILTDYTVDKGTLNQLGYQSVYQVSLNDQQAAQSTRYSNNAVMDYLRRIVPRMFQNTLSLLSRQIIQQFLDELVWRERWGIIPARAFETMIAHMAEQTKLDTGDSLMARLNKIATNPFKNWEYKNWQSNCSTSAASPISRFVVGSNEPVIIAAPTITSQPASPLPSIDQLPASLQQVDSSGSSNTGKRSRKPGKAVGEPEIKKRPVMPPVSTGKLRPLDSYYYGTIKGDQDILDQLKQKDLNMKCVLCNMVIKDNMRLMRHLIGHAYNEGSYTFSDSSPQCRHCLKDFITDFSLQSHIEESHQKGSLLCLICRDSSRDRTNLILHMHHNHMELECPYRCGICNFRSSEHNVLIDHFHEVHKNTDKLQCPFCLKVVSMQTSDGRKISQNQYFFIHHIQKHQRKSLARKCNKCVLWFVHKDLIKEHSLKDHFSCKDVPGVESYPVDIETVMMPVPLGNGTQPPKSTGSKSKNTLINNFTVNNFSALNLSTVDKDSICCECEGEVIQSNHYPGFLSCLKCRFSTCCSKAMNEHFVIYHDKPDAKPQFNVGKVITLKKPLYCVCGFFSQSGNKLAFHLAKCKRKSAYPSAERAAQCTLQGQSASFPPLVTLDEEEGDAEDHEQKWLRAFAQPRTTDIADQVDKQGNAISSSPSMLNILGLVRKPSTDESSLEKTPSDGDPVSEAMEVDDKTVNQTHIA